MRVLSPIIAMSLLASCNNTDNAIETAVRSSLVSGKTAKIVKITSAVAGETEYACVTVNASNRLGVFTEGEVVLVKDSKLNWQTVEGADDLSHESCLNKLATDLSGANDSVAFSNLPEEDDGKPRREVGVPFDRREVAYFSSYGDNVIQGVASLKTKAGDTRYCSNDSEAISLIPVSRYAKERMKLNFGNDRKGFRGTPNHLAPGDPLYLKLVKDAPCDEYGRFLFEHIPDGEYFIFANVFWKVQKPIGSPTSQGGILLERVTVKGGEVAKVVLTA